LDAHLSDLFREATGVDRIAIIQEIAGISLGDLTCRPFRTGMGGDIEVNHPPSLID